MGIGQVKMAQSLLFLMIFGLFFFNAPQIVVSPLLIFRVLKKLILTFFEGGMSHCFNGRDGLWRLLLVVMSP